jgi:hypothetical protein
MIDKILGYFGYYKLIPASTEAIEEEQYESDDDICTVTVTLDRSGNTNVYLNYDPEHIEELAAILLELNNGEYYSNMTAILETQTRLNNRQSDFQRFVEATQALVMDIKRQEEQMQDSEDIINPIEVIKGKGSIDEIIP